jgi:hypothetical protein
VEHPFVNYYFECEWIKTTVGRTRNELSSLAIDHACSTDHDIGGERIRTDRPATESDRPPDPDSEGTDRPKLTALTGPERTRVYSVNDEYRGDDGNRDRHGTRDEN